MNAQLPGHPNLCMEQVTRYSPNPCAPVLDFGLSLSFSRGQEGLGEMPANETEIVPDLEMSVYESQNTEGTEEFGRQTPPIPVEFLPRSPLALLRETPRIRFENGEHSVKTRETIPPFPLMPVASGIEKKQENQG